MTMTATTTAKLEQKKKIELNHELITLDSNVQVVEVNQDVGYLNKPNNYINKNCTTLFYSATIEVGLNKVECNYSQHLSNLDKYREQDKHIT